MKNVLTVCAFLSAVVALSANAQAAPKQQRTYEACTQMADQRGFMAAEKYGGRKRFVNRCMRGAQQ
ncbi:hypothetical protein SAMN05216374_0956 [Tardiphaga sp. OK246]|uniref:hypothetical protein n=1 Tax=Tardiphaga sp. OK246 TaxID=1855307 RepID=UPI000B63F21F|nr:hypothetical protein [Tardiphaga sp. OK246]SNS35648.1 hypothetical protein SAMN05216374_0956 [Tardiphaga sp. OK246]